MLDRPSDFAVSQQGEELLDGQSSVRDDTTKGSEPYHLVIGDDDTTVGHVAPKNHVTASLATEDETGTLQRCTHPPA